MGLSDHFTTAWDEASAPIEPSRLQTAPAPFDRV